MARHAFFKPESSNSTATIGLENGGQPSGATSPDKSKPQGERGGVHPLGVPPLPAQRDGLFLEREASLQVVSKTKDIIANGGMFSNQSGKGDIHATFQHRFCLTSYASIAA